MGQSLLHHKYIIEQELGRGGFGITYKATNPALAQTVVVKTLNESLRQDPSFANFQRHFQDEARRLAKFAHPYIVRVSDFFIEDGLPYIVMDYIPGQTLDTIVLPDRPLPEAIALDYIRQVGEAVKVVHQNGLLHRDIKPQNLILRQGTQQVVLIDFGIAREFTPGLTQTHTHWVSEGYAPIEQYLPKAQRTPATDIYGLAATLYTLLTAQVPVAAILRDRLPLAAPHELRPELSVMVSQAVMRGMAVEPHHRPASVDEWLALLGNLPNHQFSTAAAGSTSQVATVAVAPAPRGSTLTETGKVTVAPLGQRSGSRFLWILPLVGLAGIVPLVLSEARSRSPNSPDASTVQPSTPASPAPVPVPEAAFTPRAEEPESPLPTATEPSPIDESATANEQPSPDNPATPTDSEVPVQPEANIPVEAQPVPSEPEPPMRETEEPRRSEEQTREDRKREQEQAREARRREQEQVREARRREQEDGREEDRGEGEERD